jgi:outer membrane protein OmpA-like peptidoglycan-associated protein/tetratricopeptide (TPR) repeat protein
MTIIKRLTGLLALVLAFSFGYAQNVDFKSSNFKDKKEELKKAIDNIEKGDEFLEAGNRAVVEVNNIGYFFETALYHYLQAQEFNPNNGLLNYKIGNAYLYTNEKYKAREYLDRAIKLQSDLDPKIYIYLGLAYQLDGKYDEALTYYHKFEVSAKSKDVEEYASAYKKYMKECRSAKEIQATKERVWVDNLKAINSPNDDYSPCISADGEVLIFSSTRKNAHSPSAIGLYDSDVYTSTFSKGGWSAPKNIGSPVNTDKNETAASLAYDGQRMLLFKVESDHADIFESKLNGLKWSAPEAKMPSNVNTTANESYASYEPADIKVFYIYDGKSKGDQDIFFSGVMDRNKNLWGKGQSVGSEVNSKYNEGSVYIHPDGFTMYFSSQGHNSMGGYDIFKSELINGQWSKPVNLGYPINTPYDDLFFAGTANGKHAFIASNRAGGAGGLDIYKVTFWGPEKQLVVDSEDFLLASLAEPVKEPVIEEAVEVQKKSLTVFKGKVVDYLTRKPLEAQLDITDNSNGKIIQTVTSNSATGKFLLSLPSGLNYGIAVRKEGYLFHSENFNLPEFSEFNMVDKEVALKNIAVGSKIALRNVFFATGKADITADSYPELMRLVDLMKQVPKLKIELSGHTDNVGSESINQKLSQERAEAVKAYLVSKGIKADRLRAKGYGSTQPVESNDTAEGRQSNRRTEYEIIAN